MVRVGPAVELGLVRGVALDGPDVIDAVVLPLPHPTRGEEPGAIVTLAEGAETSADEIRAFAAERLAAFKAPVRIVIWDGLLPRKPAGKILRAVEKGLRRVRRLDRRGHIEGPPGLVRRKGEPPGLIAAAYEAAEANS